MVGFSEAVRNWMRSRFKDVLALNCSSVAGKAVGGGAELRADGESPLPLTAEAREASQIYDSERSPANTCEPVNMPPVLHAPNYLYDVRIADDEVILYHEVYEVTRTVPLNSGPKQAEPSGLFGMVSGRIEGDELVVESSEYQPSRWGAGDRCRPTRERLGHPFECREKNYRALLNQG